MKEMIAIFTSKDANEAYAVRMECEDGKFGERFQNACANAKAGGFIGFNSQIPYEYLKQAGLSMTPVDFMEIESEMVGTKAVSPCECRQCSAYEDGSCFHYGGLVDGFSTDCERIHGTGGNILTYDDDEVTGKPFDTALDPADAVAFILKSNDPELLDLKDEIEEFINDNFDDDSQIDPALWGYNND